MKRLMSVLLAFCIIIMSFGNASAENINEINKIKCSDNDRYLYYLSFELSKFFEKENDGNIYFKGTKSDLRNLGISQKDADVILSFTSNELNQFANHLDSSLIIDKPNNKFNNNLIQPYGFVGLNLHLGPKVRSMSAVVAGGFAGGFVGWHLKELPATGPWGAGAAGAISASVAGVVGWAVSNHLTVVPVGVDIPGISWSRDVSIP